MISNRSLESANGHLIFLNNYFPLTFAFYPVKTYFRLHERDRTVLAPPPTALSPRAAAHLEPRPPPRDEAAEPREDALFLENGLYRGKAQKGWSQCSQRKGRIKALTLSISRTQKALGRSSSQEPFLLTFSKP
jgi:hypothetical protein